jgi:FixJ family two-component response regulator
MHEGPIAAVRSTRSNASMRHEPALIAIVDDEPSICRAMLRLLRSANFRAEAFDSAAGFIEFLARQTPDCLILDLQMPTMTGIELQEHLLRSQARVPVIIITAHDQPEAAERCLALGASLYLRKPIEGALLIDSIRTIVGEDVALSPHPP